MHNSPQINIFVEIFDNIGYNTPFGTSETIEVILCNYKENGLKPCIVSMFDILPKSGQM